MEPEPLCLEVREALSHGLVMSVCRVLFEAIHVERRVSTGVGVCQPLKKRMKGLVRRCSCGHKLDDIISIHVFNQ